MANEQESAELHVLLRSDIDQQADNIGGFLVDSSTTSYGWICFEWSQIQLHQGMLFLLNQVPSFFSIRYDKKNKQQNYRDSALLGNQRDQAFKYLFHSCCFFKQCVLKILFFPLSKCSRSISRTVRWRRCGERDTWWTNINNRIHCITSSEWITWTKCTRAKRISWKRLIR